MLGKCTEAFHGGYPNSSLAYFMETPIEIWMMTGGSPTETPTQQAKVQLQSDSGVAQSAFGIR